MTAVLDLSIGGRIRYCERCLVSAREPTCFVCGRPMVLVEPSVFITRYRVDQD